MNCSSCAVRAEVEAGKYAGATWEATPCSRCVLKQGTSYSIAYNDNRLPKPEMEYAGADHTFTEDGELSLPISVMTTLTAGLLRMSPRARDVVCMRCQGWRYREIADKFGVTASAIEMMHKRAIKKFPLLAALFFVKTGKRKRRNMTTCATTYPAKSGATASKAETGIEVEV